MHIRNEVNMLRRNGEAIWNSAKEIDELAYYFIKVSGEFFLAFINKIDYNKSYE